MSYKLRKLLEIEKLANNVDSRTSMTEVNINDSANSRNDTSQILRSQAAELTADGSSPSTSMTQFAWQAGLIGAILFILAACVLFICRRRVKTKRQRLKSIQVHKSRPVGPSQLIAFTDQKRDIARNNEDFSQTMSRDSLSMLEQQREFGRGSLTSSGSNSYNAASLYCYQEDMPSPKSMRKLKYMGIAMLRDTTIEEHADISSHSFSYASIASPSNPAQRYNIHKDAQDQRYTNQSVSSLLSITSDNYLDDDFEHIIDCTEASLAQDVRESSASQVMTHSSKEKPGQFIKNRRRSSEGDSEWEF